MNIPTTLRDRLLWVMLDEPDERTLGLLRDNPDGAAEMKVLKAEWDNAIAARNNAAIGIHNRIVSLVKQDLQQKDISTGSAETPKWGGRVLLKDDDAYLYVRFVRNEDQTIRYVISNFSIPEDVRGGGLVKKIIETVKANAPECLTTIEFECVNNKRLFRHLTWFMGFSDAGNQCVSLNFAGSSN